MTDSSYEMMPDFGALYDAVPAYVARPDVPFYVEQAAQSRTSMPATVLELGCGTGRILLALARRGHTVTGLDQSDAMLAQCRAKLAEEPGSVRNRVSLSRSDVRDFTVAPPAARGFDLAVAPFRVLQHLTTATDQLRCLSTVHRHLAPGGMFVFDVFNPNYPLMTRDRSQEVEDTAERALPDGRYLRRTVRVTAVRWVGQVSDVELTYYIRTGGTVQRVVQAFPMRWYTPPELEHLLERSGFRVEAVYGNFDRSPLTDESPEIVNVAVRQ